LGGEQKTHQKTKKEDQTSIEALFSKYLRYKIQLQVSNG
jgi:hypothetical protein